MATSRLASIGRFYTWLVLNSKCAFLYARNLLSRTELDIKSITIDEPTLLSKSYANISINALGCQRIEIASVGRFPGNATKIKIPFDGRSTSYEVRLYGRNRLFRKVIAHNVIYLDLFQNKPPIATLPKVIGLQFEDRLYAPFNSPIRSEIFERGIMVDIHSPSLALPQPDLEPYKAKSLLTFTPNEQRILQHT